jgi:hypothetical protein
MTSVQPHQNATGLPVGHEPLVGPSAEPDVQQRKNHSRRRLVAWACRQNGRCSGGGWVNASLVEQQLFACTLSSCDAGDTNYDIKALLCKMLVQEKVERQHYGGLQRYS